METKQVEWFSEIMKSTETKSKAEIPDHLKLRLDAIPNEYGVYSFVFPIRTVYMAVASFTLLITINMLAIRNNNQQNKKETYLDSEYFSYLNQL